MKKKNQMIKNIVIVSPRCAEIYTLIQDFELCLKKSHEYWKKDYNSYIHVTFTVWCD
jgi:hypothetical protein